MPLTVRLPCWGDLGRYKANNYGLPTFRRRFESSCKLICCVAVHLRSFDVLHSQCNQRCGPRGSSLYKGSARYTVVTVAVLKLTAIDSGRLSETARRVKPRCHKSGCLAPKIRCASLDQDPLLRNTVAGFPLRRFDLMHSSVNSGAGQRSGLYKGGAM